MKKALWVIAVIAMTGPAWGQVGSTVKEGAKATGEKAHEIGDHVKGAVSSEPNKSEDKAKANIHKAKAHYHARKAKKAAKDIPK